MNLTQMSYKSIHPSKILSCATEFNNDQPGQIFRLNKRKNYLEIFTKPSKIQVKSLGWKAPIATNKCM